MKNQIASSIEQSKRLLSCGVDPKTADMSVRTIVEPYGEDMAWHIPKLLTLPYDEAKTIYGDDEITPAWSLSALMTLLPPTLTIGKDKWWLDIAPLDSGNQWGIGYYNMDKPRTIKGLTHKADLMECAVEEIEWLTANGYSLNKIEE